MGKSLIFRLFVVLFALTLASQILAQGGQGGIGGGSFQGNQGGRGGQAEESFPPRNLSDPEWDEKSMILTQGDKVEWKMKGVKGQTLFATVRSDVFDPAIKMLNAKGKVVAENDDQYDGNQSPFLVFQFPDDQEYKLTVQNYRSTGGGRFNIYTRTFMPVDLVLGANTAKVSLTSPDGPRLSQTFLHIKATEGVVYAIPAVEVKRGNGKQRLGYQMMIGPTGVYKSDFYNYRPNGGEPLFEAKKTGDYYLFYGSPLEDGELTARLDTIEVQKVEKTGAIKLDLLPLGQKILKFTVNKGDIIRRQIESSASVGFEQELTTVSESKEKDKEEPARRGDANDSVKNYQPKYLDGLDVYNLYTQKVDVTMIVRANENKPTSVTLRHSADIPTWEDGMPATGKIGLGETKYFMISGKKGDIQRLKGQADGFELLFSLVDMDGNARSFMDQRTHRPGTELRYSENEKFLVTVTSPQGGGSGTFSMDLNSAKPEPITLGTTVTYRDGPAFGTYAIEVEQGVRYQLLSNDINSGFSFIDDEGNTLGGSGQNFGGQHAVYFVPKRKGVLKIKVDGGQGSTKFRLDKHVLPEITR